MRGRNKVSGDVWVYNPYANPYSNGCETLERKRFIRLNKALAFMAVLLVLLFATNTALAWLIDEDTLINDMSLGSVNTTYASIIKSHDGSSTSLVFGNGQPDDGDGEVVETFYGFVNNDNPSLVPWKEHIGSIDTLIFKDPIKPKNTSGWFAGASNLVNFRGIENLDMSDVDNASCMFQNCSKMDYLDLSNCSATCLTDCSYMFDGCSALKELNMVGLGNVPNELPDQNSCSTYGMFTRCGSLEQIVISSSFSFSSDDAACSLQAPDPKMIPDADGCWYINGEGEPLTCREATCYINDRYNPDGESVTLKAYGPGYAAVYGDTTLIFGRGVIPATYNDLSLSATYHGMENMTQNFANAEQSPWHAYKLNEVLGIAKRKIPVKSTANWFTDQYWLTSVDLNVLDMSSCIDANRMFYMSNVSNSLLVSVKAESWDLSNVENMCLMFFGCKNLTELDVSGWNVSKPGNTLSGLQDIFSYCESLEKIDISTWKICFTRNYPWSGANLDYYAISLFRNCKSLKDIDLSGFSYDPNWNVVWRWDLGGCDSLEKITVPSTYSFRNNALPTPLSNRNGISNSNYWYENGEGEPLTSAQVCDIIRANYNLDAAEITYKTFIANKVFLPSDAYAAYYVDSTTSRNELIMNRGDVVPETYDGMSLSNVYREIETKPCGWSTVANYVKQTKILTELKPQSCANWFLCFNCMTNIEGLEKLDTSQCTSFYRMFYYASTLNSVLGIEAWDVSSATTFEGMFYECNTINSIDVSHWQVSDNLESRALYQTFYGCNLIEEVDMSLWNIPKVYSGMCETFKWCSNLKKVSFPHLLPEFNSIGGVRVLENCPNLEEIVVPNDFCFDSAVIPSGKKIIGKLENQGFWYEDMQGSALSPTELHENLTSRFRDGGKESHWYVAKNYTDQDVWAAIYEDALIMDKGSIIPDTYEGKQLSRAFRELEHPDFYPNWFPDYNHRSLLKSAKIYTEIHPASLRLWFADNITLASIEGLNLLNTEGVKDFSWMFSGCQAVKSLDVSNFDISSATTLYQMFAGCWSLTKLDLSNWNMPKWSKKGATERIFSYCLNLEELILSPTFNFSDTDNSKYDFGISFPGSTNDKEGYICASLWYENGVGRPYSFYDAGKYVNTLYGTKDEATVWTRYPIEGAYAAVYKSLISDDLSLVFGRGVIEDVKDQYPDHELRGIALGFEYYAFEDMEYGVYDPPWKTSYNTGYFKEIIVKDSVKPVSIMRWFELFTDCTTFDLSKLDTSSCTDFFKVFASCRSIEELDLSAWDTSNITRYGTGGYNSIFYDCLKLKKINLSNWNFSSIKDRNVMFVICPQLEEINMSGCVYENAPTLVDQCYRLKKVTVSSGMTFSGDFFSAITDHYESGFDGKWYLDGAGTGYSSAEVKDYMSNLDSADAQDYVWCAGYGDNPYVAIYKDISNSNRTLVFGRGAANYDIPNMILETVGRDIEKTIYNAVGNAPQNNTTPWHDFAGSVTQVINNVPADNPIKPLSLNGWFYSCDKLTSIDLSMFDVSEIEDVSSMFYGCINLSDIKGLDTWDTSNIKYMNSLFAGCKVDNLNAVQSWNTSSLKDMGWMFWDCNAVTSLDLSSWNIDSLTNNVNAFYQCSALQKLKLPAHFVKSSMTEIGQMFLECRSLVSVDLSDWDISGITSLCSLFHNCFSLKTINGIEDWNTSSIVNMSQVFYKCSVLNVDCTKWDVSSVEDHSSFAYQASGVKEPIWIVADTSKLNSELNSDSLESEGVQLSECDNDPESGDRVLKAGDKELALDEDAQSISDGQLEMAWFMNRPVKQIRFKVNLLTNEKYEFNYYR